MYLLLDKYAACGTDLDSFRKEAIFVDENTCIAEVDPLETRILDYYKISHTRAVFHVINDGDIRYTEDGRYVVTNMEALRIDTLNSDQLSLIQEMRAKSKTLIEFTTASTKRFFVGETLYKTLSARLNGIGGRFLKQANSIRNYALVGALQDSDSAMHILYRTDGRLNKAVAVFSKKVRFCKRTAIADVIEKLFPKGEIRWSITQECTEVYVEMPELVCGEFYKGYLFKISDTGYYADTLYTTLRKYDCQPDDYYTLGEIPLAYGEDGVIGADGVIDENALKKHILVSEAHNQDLVAGQRRYFEECRLSPMELSLKLGLSSIIGIKNRKVILEDISNKGISEPTDFYDYLVSLPRMIVLSDYQKEAYRNFLNNLSKVAG